MPTDADGAGRVVKGTGGTIAEKGRVSASHARGLISDEDAIVVGKSRKTAVVGHENDKCGQNSPHSPYSKGEKAVFLGS